MQLRFFIEIAKHQNISRAADELFRTQSAVTRGLLELEKNLKVRLFERHHQGVLLTNAGQYILPRVKNAIAHLQEMIHLIKEQDKQKNLNLTADPFFLYNQQRLTIFLTLCLTKNMKNTAQLLDITQPAVSATIKILEQSFNTSLFDRTVQGLKETPFCRLLKQQVQLCLNELKPLPDDLKTFNGQLQGTVHIGALPLIRAECLPQVMLKTTTQYPAIHFVTYESAYEILSAQLRVGDIDFIVGAIRPDESISDFQQHILFSEDMAIAIGHHHPLLDHYAIEDIQLEELLKFPWILPRALTPARELILRSFNQLGLNAPEPTIETGDQTLIRGLLQSSHLVAIVSKSQMQFELKHGYLIRLPIILPSTDRDIGISYRKHAILSRAAQTFLNNMLECSSYIPVSVET